jgi:hypothetical protein
MLGMDRQDGIPAEIARARLDQSLRFQGVDQRRGPVQLFKRIHNPPMHHILLGLVGQLSFREEHLHDRGPGC